MAETSCQGVTGKITQSCAWITTMNQHLPVVPQGPGRRQPAELPYSSTVPPNNMRSPPAFIPYPPHLNSHPSPAYSPQWYPAYPQVQLPPRPYQPPYGPLIVSSYPPSQPAMGPAPIPPPSLPLQPPRTSTPLQSTMSPPTAAPPPSQIDLHGRSPVPISASALPNTIPSPATPAAKPAARAAPPLPPTPFRAPVSLYELVGEFPFTDLNSKVPWLSVPDSPFPARLPRRRRNSRLLQSSSISVELPVKETQRKDPIKPAEQAQP